ncbi:hypothetical protein [Fibrobacter sp. UWP2]|uniref:hypothetical protein n=1 Tax=Fibrobacter sp. UWP2 TaxID=1896216 RepID=UPI001160A9EE|nr:hypothetical protein [Fibrobacter sp. UWP2]
MKISESIEAHLSTAVAGISQRNQATLPARSIGHLIFLIPVFNRLYRLAKAFGFCLYFLLSPWSKATPRDRVHMDSIALTGLQNDITKQVFI